MKLLFLALVAVIIAGCAVQLPKVPEFAFNWVSKEGKSQEQLYEDQAACRRDLELLQPPVTDPGVIGWDVRDMKPFDDCVRAKGWIKK